MGYISTWMGDCFSSFSRVSDGFAARTSRPKPLSALLTSLLLRRLLCFIRILIISVSSESDSHSSHHHDVVETIKALFGKIWCWD